MSQREKFDLTEGEVSRIIQMAWEDRTPFEAIEMQFEMGEEDVIKLMREEMKGSSFRMWRERMAGRKTKHRSKRGYEVGRFRSDSQRNRY